jgi:hypothetical protein
VAQQLLLLPLPAVVQGDDLLDDLVCGSMALLCGILAQGL